MFRIISSIAFIVTLAGIVIHCICSGPKFDDLFGKERRWRILDGLRVFVLLLTMMLPVQKHGVIGTVRKTLYTIALAAFSALVITGFVPPLMWGQSISGYWLMIHVTAGGILVACLAALAVIWADRCRFNPSDRPWAKASAWARKAKQAPLPDTASLTVPEKICFWLIIALALPVVLSIVLSMFPIFGTDMQKLLAQVHRYLALAFATVVIIHIYILIFTRTEQ